MALALLVLGRAAHLPLRQLQRRGDARLLVLVLHDGPVKDVVPLEACMHAYITHSGPEKDSVHTEYLHAWIICLAQLTMQSHWKPACMPHRPSC